MNLEKILDNPKTAKERLIALLFIPVCIICGALMIILYFCYWLLGLFIFDAIYYVLTGDTIVFKHLPT